MARAPLAVLAALVLAGCLAAPPAAEPVAPAGSPVPDVRPALAAPVFGAPVLLGKADFGAEPSIVVGPGQEVYVVTPLRLWRSTDGGASFEELGDRVVCQVVFVQPPVCPPGFEHPDPGLDGGGDGDMAADGAGNLYWAGLFGQSGPVPFQLSRDQGATWSAATTLAEKTHSTDREWIDARPDGRLYVTWRDFTGTSQLVFRTSPDGGATWDPVRNITEDHLQGPIVHDPSSAAVYTPYYKADQGVWIAKSIDQGVTWQQFEVFGTGATPSLGSNGGSHIFPVAAVDSAGTVYVVFSVDDPAPAAANEVTFPVVRLTVSRDGGATWNAPMQLSAPGKTAIFPWIAAGKPGRVAVGWYENRLGAPSDVAPDVWDVILQESVTADADAPVFAGGPANRDPVHLGILGTESPYRSADRSHLDFFEIAIRADGQPVLTWVGDAVPPRTHVEVHAAAVQEGTPLR